MLGVVDHRHVVKPGSIVFQVRSFLFPDVEEFCKLVGLSCLALAPVHEQLDEDFDEDANEDEKLGDDADEALERAGHDCRQYFGGVVDGSWREEHEDSDSADEQEQDEGNDAEDDRRDADKMFQV